MISKNIFLIGLFLPLLIIPAFAYATTSTISNPTNHIIIAQVSQGTSCDSSAFTKIQTTSFHLRLPSETSQDECITSVLKFNTQPIPDSSIIENIRVEFDKSTQANPLSCTYTKVTGDPTTTDAATLWNQIKTGQSFIDDDFGCLPGGANLYVDLESQARSEMQSTLASDIFNVGIYFTQQTRDGSVHASNLANPRLIITYTATTEPPPEQTPPPVIDDSPRNFLIYKDNGIIYAKNTDNNQIEFNSADINEVIDYALAHLGTGRTTQQKIEIQGDYTLTKKIRLEAYTWLKISGKLSFADDYPFQNSMIDTDKQIVKPMIKITDGTLNGNKKIGSFNSGIFLHNVTGAIIDNVTVENFTHVGIYIKEGHNSKITNNKVSNIGLAGDIGVGSGIAWLGGNNNEICFNNISNNKGGQLEAGIQIEADDESTEPNYFSNSKICNNIIKNNGRTTSLTAVYTISNQWTGNIIVNGDLNIISGNNEQITKNGFINSNVFYNGYTGRFQENFIYNGTKLLEGIDIIDSTNIIAP